MKNRLKNISTILFAAVLTACASESFDAPLDAGGDDPVARCAGVPEPYASGCVLYDGFGAGLSRWHEHATATEEAPVKMLTVADDERQGILQVGHCPGLPVSRLETELRLKAPGQITIRTEWRSVEKDNPAALRIELDGAVLDYPERATGSPPRWMSTAVTVTATSARPILRVQAHSLSETLCANVWVDWLAVSE